MKVIAITLVLIGCTKKPAPSCKPYNGIVKSIGGCDKWGYCSVMLEDGTVVRNTYMPVVGETLTKACKEE